MADTASIAATRRDAFERLQQAMRILGDELGIEAISLTRFNRDPEWLQARQLSQMADYLDSVVKTLLSRQVAPMEPFEPEFSDEQLGWIAEQLGEVVPDDATREAVIHLILSHGTEPSAGESSSTYAELTREALAALVAEREIDVAGTGKNGYVTVEDMRAALDADDAAKVQAQGDNHDDSAH